MPDLKSLLAAQGSHFLGGTPEGLEAILLAGAARAGLEILHIARDDARLAALEEALSVVAPELELLVLPAWDTVPYDRASPHADILARRLDTLSRLAAQPQKPGRIVLAPVASALQRLVPAHRLKEASFSARSGGAFDREGFTSFLEINGFVRTETVMEPGEYAIRGGIVDLYPPGSTEPLRIDLFGDEIERIRAFDPLTQRTSGEVSGFSLSPMSETPLDQESIARFRTGYRELFGAVSTSDPLYEAVSAGRRHPGLEHWLALFHDGLDTLFAYLPCAAVTLDYQVAEAIEARLGLVREYYQARQERTAAEGGIYNPLPPERMFLDVAEWERHLKARPCVAFSPFAPSEGQPDAGGRPGHDFAEIRVTPGADLFAAFADFLAGERKAGQRTVLTVQGEGARERLAHMLAEHKVAGVVGAASWDEALKAPVGALALVLWGLERGFTHPGLTVVAEPDLLGERLSRPARKKRRAEHFLTEASALSEGDLVVHVEHGIARYEGLEALTVGGAPHDCLRLVYDGGDKLYVPVENIEVLTRYGADEGTVALDKLGGQAWQARKAKLKKRIRDMAEQLIAVAAKRQVRKGAVFQPPEGLYDEFCSRFPYAETEDQLAAIADVIEDFAAGRPMDRLVCGDVGFGKTEVALRAAFVAALSGHQVAVVVPTTLLARQHYRTFTERFKGLPVRVEQLSRLVPANQATRTKKDLAEGRVEIVVGTHALLAKSISFKDLGLLIVDEEQHFGVSHKERLKQMRADVHVLTLTATPIPRTLQLALTGVREMSVIATPPVDRLAVRTFVQPFDSVLIREALLREHYRGGQSFYVCPRVADIDRLVDQLKGLVPELKLAVAHGQLAPSVIEEVMTRFGDGEQDILLATNIIESGLDMPRVNTLIIHRADMFGLAQLYQLRGRVGRAKQRGYAYFTLPPGRLLTKSATKRLEVMQALDSLGAGFTLASHDLDIRGAGNLLGEEQSGHIKEVGIELYQHLLEEAVAAARGDDVAQEQWSPQIGVGSPVLIPESYVVDLGLRLSLYRRIADVKERAEIDDVAFELVDRFGPMPLEVENLLNIVAIKIACRQAGIDKLEAGPKGAVIAFRNNVYANPAGLVDLISRQVGTIKLRPDHKLVVMRNWEEAEARIKGAEKIALELARLAGEATPRS
ncbi:MAG: transcription-repair coupling factor [Alphaproteobacteria bacterium]|nr:transcription-repair coupling factor [Alphaproteobacteria bacterium]